jgi:methylenetetrahydrofolate dehydrogenase (NADP+)/methenyltetrahydrofolate cyclohydrolase
MANIINGKAIASGFSYTIKDQVSTLKESGIYPKLALISASDDPASEVYLAKKIKAAEFVGIKADIHKFPPEATADDISDLIKKLNNDNEVHGILLQSPLTKGLDFRKLIDMIVPNKDVDGLTTHSQGSLFVGKPGVIPCTPLGILHLLRIVHQDMSGLHAVVCGRSSIVGKPMAQLLLNQNCSVTILHSYSSDMAAICRTADILVIAIGRPRFIKKNFVKPGATVIDVGINRIIENDKKMIVGDVDFDRVSEIVGAITPVPNGVGPMTVAYLMHNTVKLACLY